MFSSIRARLWLSYAALIVTALLAVMIVLILFLLRNPFTFRQTFLRLNTAETVLAGESDIGGHLVPVARAFSVRMVRFDSQGLLLQDSAASGVHLGLPAGARKDRAFGSMRDPSGQMWLFSLVRLSDGSWLLTAAPRPKLLPAIGLLTDELFRPVLQGLLIGLLLALVLAYGLARWIGDPLQQLIAAARRVFVPRLAGVGGEPGRASEAEPTPVPERGPEEVRELTRAFNAMVARVDSSQRSQRDLVANVSHELKTPLTSIQGFAQALIEGAAESPDQRRQAAEVIFSEAERMHRLVLELLDLARLDAGTAEMSMSELDIGAVVRSTVERFAPMAASAGVRLEYSGTDQLPRIAADADRLTQVLANLLDNALKFTPRGGTISLFSAAEKDGIQIAITDTGVGIDPQDLPHIFDRFYQADVARGGGETHGAGLGLAIARQIVEAHGGRITVRSAQGRGARFIVHLPLNIRNRG